MSILNIEKKALFIHIPKTAGTSMEHRDFLYGAWFKHHNITFFRDALRQIKDYRLEDFFKFAFVRNPYTRIASGIVRHNLADKVEDKETFSNWIIDNQETIRHLPKGSQWLHMIPMHEFIYIDDKLEVDFVGRFERLKRDWKFVCDEVGVSDELGNAMSGKFAGSDYEHLYTPEAKGIVGDIFKKDFELFGYEL